MIKVIFATARNHFSGIKVTGHAYSDEPGRDLVCAAVSTLSQTLLNAIEVVGKIPEEEMLCQVEKGYLKFSIDSKWQSDSLDLVFKTILIGIEGIERTYPEYVKHIIKEVHEDVENF